MTETMPVRIKTIVYEDLRKALIKKNKDIRKGDLQEAVSEAIEKYIAEELL